MKTVLVEAEYAVSHIQHVPNVLNCCQILRATFPNGRVMQSSVNWWSRDQPQVFSYRQGGSIYNKIGQTQNRYGGTEGFDWFSEAELEEIKWDEDRTKEFNNPNFCTPDGPRPLPTARFKR